VSIDLSYIDACLRKLRYVVYGAEVKSSDVNDVVECLKAMSIIFRDVRKGDPLVDELDAIIKQIRYVRSGDVIKPEDHNFIVDALWKARDIIGRMESEYMKIIELMKVYTYVFGIGLEYAVSPLIKLFYKMGILKYIDCIIYNRSPYSEFVLEKYIPS
jgi:hypothetical protein